MNLATGTSPCNTLGQATKYFLAVLTLTTVKLVDALEQMSFEFFATFGDCTLAGFLILLQAAQTGENDFADSPVEAAVDFILHELFQLWRQ